MANVFISHSSHDQSFVEKELLPLLRDGGIDFWYSAFEIASADEWERSILQGLKTCDTVLVVMSPHSAKSKWVKREVDWAFDVGDRKVVPVLLRQCNPDDFHIAMRAIQRIDFTLERETARSKLLAVWNARPKPRLTLAREWALELTKQAVDCLERQETEMALGKLTDAIEFDPTYPRAYLLRANLALIQGQYDKAAQDCLTAIRLNPDDVPMAHQVLCSAFLKKGNLREAISAADDAIRIDRNNISARIVRATALASLGRLDDAIKEYDETLVVDPSSAETYAGRADAFVLMRKFAAAVEDYTRAIALKPGVSEFHWKRAEAWLGSGRPELAIDDYTVAAEGAPNAELVFKRRGIAHLESRHWQDAIADLTRAIKTATNDAQSHAQSHFARALAHLGNGAYDKAIRDCNKAIRLGLSKADVYATRGLLYCKNQNPAKAVADCNKAIRLDDQCVHGYCNRALAHLLMNQNVKAISDFSHAIQINPNQVLLSLEQAKLLDPKNATIYNDCAMAIRRDSKSVDSLSMLKNRAPTAKKQVEIKSDTVGTFYYSPSPDAPPFVRVGSKVTPETVVGLVEAMKLFNEITADCAGVIAEILVENKQAVEHNQVLYRVDPTE